MTWTWQFKKQTSTKITLKLRSRGFCLSEIQVYIFLNVYFLWYNVQVTKWRFFASKNKSSWVRNTGFFFQLGFLSTTMDLWIFIFHFWPDTSGTKCPSITRWWYPLDMETRDHCPCFRSSAFTADLAFREELLEASP